MKRKVACLFLASFSVATFSQPISSQIFKANLDELDLNAPAIVRKGASCRAVVAHLKRMKSEKGEFETTAEFDARMDLVDSSPMLGIGNPLDHFVFVPADLRATAVFDADRGKMIAKFGLPHTQTIQSFGMPNSVRVAILDQGRKSKSNYVASNAFGKKVNAVREEYDVCALAFQNTRADSLVSVEVEFDLPSEEARLVKERLSVALVGTLVRPYLGRFDYSSPATLGNPLWLEKSGDAMRADLVQYWIYDRKTGKVYARGTKY